MTKFNQTKGLTLSQALKQSIPIRRFPYFKKQSLLRESDFLLTEYRDKISNYKLSKEDLMSQDWELSDQIFKQFQVKSRSFRGEFHVFIDKEIGNLNTNESIRAVEKKEGHSVLSFKDLEMAFNLFGVTPHKSYDNLFKTHYSLAEALQSGLPMKIDSSLVNSKLSQDIKCSYIKNNEEDKIDNYTLSQEDITSEYWILKEQNLREFVLCCTDEGYHKSEKHTGIKEGRESIGEEEALTLIEVPINFKVFNYEILAKHFKELEELSEKNRVLFCKFLGFIPWEVDLLKKVL